MRTKKVYLKLLKLNYNISFVESMTTGSLAFELGKIPGASKVLSSSIITYQISQKIDLLNIDKSFFELHNVVSMETAEIMADNFQKLSKSEVVISVTGNAGPTMQKDSNKIAWICIKIIDKKYFYQIDLNKNRKRNINKTKRFIYKELLNIL